MYIRCLGSLAVFEADQQRPLGGPKQRLVLAHLLIRANRVVPVDRLITEVWDGDPPAAARSSLHSYVSHLRKALGADRIEADGPGYALRVTPDEVDRLTFDHLVAEGRRLRVTDPAAAARALHDALDLWHGPPFADLADVRSLQPEITGLEELHLAAIEERVGADLDAGRDGELVGELEVLTSEHPLRERLWGQLMVALYRVGRQGDALLAYERARGVLADELGIDPSAELRSLHERVLNQDPTLQMATATLKGYRLLERIGESAFGVVWRATQPGVGREVAITVARPAIANDPAFIRRFEADAQRVAQVEHPHVVPLYDFWREPDGAYLVQRHLRGGSLRRLVDERGPPGRDRALRIADQVAQAMAAAHHRGVTHGHISPSNVLLDDDGNAYLANFRVGQEAVTAETDELTYLPPERNGGDATRDVDPRVDCYAFGVLVGRLLSDADTAVAAVLRRATAPRADERQRDGAQLLTELREALGTTVPTGDAVIAADGGGPARNPYKGLRAFTESDAADFFGRATSVARLLSSLRGDERFLAVVGPSGSGKSSVVRAGLVPALRAGAVDGSGSWFVVQMVPGDRPFDELATGLRRVAANVPDGLADRLADDGLSVVVPLLPDDGDLLVVIDQFEELFTLVTDDGQRRRFIDALVDAVNVEASRVRVVVTLRADFYDRPLEDAALGALMQRNTQTLLPLTATELEHAVTGPAERVGVTVERSLMAQMIADVTDQPGALPLLQYALTELFDSRRDSALTIAGYRDIGGVAGALSRRPETIYAGLDDGVQEATRQLFLRLVTPGEGVEDTRRRALLADMTALAPDEMPGVLGAFGEARLLSFDRHPESRVPTVEVAHEALLGEWRRLRGWIDAARDDLRTQRRLQTAAADWVAADRDQSFLATGSQLAQYEAWRDTSGLTTTRAEGDYLDASVAHRDRAAAEEEARRQRELDLERRSVRRLRTLVAVLGIAALVAGGLTIFAIGQARRAADQTVLAEDEALRAEREARVAAARELAAAADLNLDIDPERSMLLAIRAIETTRSDDGSWLPEAEEALHRAVHTSRVALRVPGVGGNVAWSPDGAIFVTEGPEDSGVIDIRDATTGASVRSWRGHETDVNDVVFGPDGSILATSGDNGELRIWNPATGELITEYVEPGDYFVWGLSISPTGDRVAAVWGFERLRIIDVATGRALVDADVSVANFNPFRTAFSPDGRRIAVPMEGDRRAAILDARTGTQLSELTSGGDTFAWSPDGRWLAAAHGFESEAVIYDAASGRLRFTLFAHAAEVRALDWTADSTRLATGSGDGTVRIWDVDIGGVREAFTLSSRGMSAGVNGVAFSADGNQVMAGEGLISRVLVWTIDDVGGGEWAAMPSSARARFPLAAAPDGRHVLTSGPARAVTQWNPRTGAKVREFGGDEPAAMVAAGSGLVAAVSEDSTLTVWDAGTGADRFTSTVDDDLVGLDVSADGRLVATANDDGPARIFDRDGNEQVTIGLEEDYAASTVALSADGARAAVVIEPIRSDGTGLVQVWDVTGGELLHTLEARSNSVDFGADGRLLAVAQEDDATVWDLSDGTLVTTLTGHLGSVWSASFDMQGTTVATTSRDGTVRLWEAQTGLPRLVLPGHDIVSAAAEFSGDGTLLSSAGGDGVSRVWALDVDDLIGIARDKLTRGLTDAECREYLHLEACPAS